MPSSTLSNESGRSIVLSSTPSTMRDSLSRRRDRTDIFTLTLSARSSFKTDLVRIARSANVDLELLDSRRRLIASSRNPGSRNELIESTDLAAGTYYLRTKLRSGDRSNYSLRCTASPLSDRPDLPGGLPADLAGNSRATARNLLLSNIPTPVRDYVGVSDESDWYSFSVGGAGNPSAKFNLSMSGLDGAGFGGAVKVTLRDNLNNVAETEHRFDGSAIAFTKTLPAGNYFLTVEPIYDTGRIPYDLSLSTQAIADAAGNTSTSARLITPSSTEQLFSDFVGSGDENDWYSFTISGQRNVTIDLSGPGGDLLGNPIRTDLRKATASGTVGDSVWSESRYDGSGFSRQETLEVGTYFVKLSSIYGADSANFDQSTFYDLKIKSTPVFTIS